MGRVAVVSFRLGLSDGVSIEAAKWIHALRELGHDVRTIAGEGPVDVTIRELALGATSAPRVGQVRDALEGCDVVIVENLASLPLHPSARNVLYEALEERDALFHHHDLPWQRAHLAHLEGPRDAPRWHHVTINRRSGEELLERGIEASTIYNHFDCDPPRGRRHETRTALGVNGERVVLLPTRALPRKNVPAALALAERLGAVFWLLGPAEDGYDEELETLLAHAATTWRQGLPAGANIHDAYAACDLVVLASTWEGFGNPTIESVTHGRPLALAPYPVSEELRALGLQFYDLSDLDGLRREWAHPDTFRMQNNLDIVRTHLNLANLPHVLSRHWRTWGFAEAR